MEREKRTKIKAVLRSSSHVLGVVLHRLPFVHSVEIELRAVSLDGLEVRSQGLLDTAMVLSQLR